MSKTFNLTYSVVALLAAMTLTNQDGTPYTGPKPTGPKTVMVSFADSTNAPDNTGGSTIFSTVITIGGIDLTQLGGEANSFTMKCPASEAMLYDLCEVFTGQLFASLNLLDRISFPPGLSQSSTGKFLTVDEFRTKYNFAVLDQYPNGSTEGGSTPPPGNSGNAG